MRKKSTRLLSAALAVCMMLSVLPSGRVCGGAEGGRTGKWRECAERDETLPLEGRGDC